MQYQATNHMERETKEIQTPAGKKLVVKTYMTARERNQLRDILLKNAKLSVGSDGANTQGMDFTGTVLTESQNSLIEIAVVQYDGRTDPKAILNTLLDGIPTEYDFVVEEAGKINGNFQQAK